MKQNYRLTIYACYISFVVQAMINNYVPLLFVTFQTEYNIPLSEITVLITLNFIVQLATSASSALYIGKINCRMAMMTAQMLSAAGLLFLAILPDMFASPFSGFAVSVCVYAAGAGLIEVIANPMIEACPVENKEKTMTMLHSFYNWGHAGIVLLSTVFFAIFGTGNWKILTLIWVTIPVFNIFLVARAPMYPLYSGGKKGMPVKELFSIKAFWLLVVLIICAGASDQAVAQWASAFAEQDLGVSKTVGDLAGPMAFALLMGTSRVIYSKSGGRINMDKYMRFSSVLCIVSYALIVFVPVPFVGLAGCALCGFATGIFHPGTYSEAFTIIKGGGAAMCAFIALGGHLGSTIGPTLSGFVSSAFNDNMKIGILSAIVFPIAMLVVNIMLSKIKNGQKECHNSLSRTAGLRMYTVLEREKEI